MKVIQKSHLILKMENWHKTNVMVFHIPIVHLNYEMTMFWMRKLSIYRKQYIPNQPRAETQILVKSIYSYLVEYQYFQFFSSNKVFGQFLAFTFTISMISSRYDIGCKIATVLVNPRGCDLDNQCFIKPTCNPYLHTVSNSELCGIGGPNPTLENEFLIVLGSLFGFIFILETQNWAI